MTTKDWTETQNFQGILTRIGDAEIRCGPPSAMGYQAQAEA